jgi:hypothetical protein
MTVLTSYRQDTITASNPLISPSFSSFGDFFCLLEHGSRPHGDVFTIRFRIIRPDVKNGLRPRAFVDHRHSIFGFDLKSAFAAVHGILDLLSDQGRWLIFHEELPQQIEFKQPTFPRHSARVLDHERGDGQVMESAIACVGKFQNEIFIKARLA